MEADQKRTYEGMFLLDAGQDFEAAAEPVRGVLERYGAELLSVKPWDERKLAYSVNGRKRGLYVLTYFSIDPSQLDEVENDCGLDERILRVLLLRKEDLSEEDIQAETPATASARRAERESRQKEEAEPAQEADTEAASGETDTEESTDESGPAEAEESSESADAAPEAEGPAAEAEAAGGDEQSPEEPEQDK